MKKLSLALLVVILVLACRQKPVVAIQPGPAFIEFSDSLLTGEFGTVSKQKQPSYTYDFRFVNKGSEPLVINKVEPNCTCIDADFPKQPIKPGEEGKIQVKLHVDELPDGFVCRSVMVYNTSKNYPVVRLQLEGIVEE